MTTEKVGPTRPVRAITSHPLHDPVGRADRRLRRGRVYSGAPSASGSSHEAPDAADILHYHDSP